MCVSRRSARGALGPLGRVAAWVGGRATHGEAPRVLTTLACHRRLFRRWLPFAAGLLRGTELPRQDVELVILRTAWNCASWYEWAQHVAQAADAGLKPAAPVRVMDGADAPGGARASAALLLGTDELHESRVISDATWVLLAEELGERELVELCFVVGHYEMLAMALNSLGVEPEPTILDSLDADTAAVTDSLRRALAIRRGNA